MATGPIATLRRLFGGLLLLGGVAVFAVRLQHEGPYAFPGGGNLRAGLLALALGAWLVRDWIPGARARIPNALAALAGLVVLFFALYAVLAELEETVTLRATHVDGHRADLRLWIVDRADGAWVTMDRGKAEAHALDGARAELLRGGELRCVVATLDERRETVADVYALRQQKYAVQRLAIAIGLMQRGGSPDTVALRLDPCAGK